MDHFLGLMAGFWPVILGFLLIGYMCGSVPFGLIFTRMAGMEDIRQIGSGNIGATNVLRTGRKGLAVATLLCDALKGTVAVIVATWIAARVLPQAGLVWAGVMAALGAFLGHIYPVWLRFKGGKGVATFLGCLIGLNIYAALIFVAIWLTIAFTTRYSSLAALVASAVSAGSLLYFANEIVAGASLLMVIFLWWKHKENIKRLLAGKETKIGQKG